ncbi:ABC transporter permease [Mucilaginibacter sabulilitoris]|uniref:ABC transporter permease n=1 Tax=Mucilaginibacter sabulilitoris TaxID=1173583 RepID=A0ABZ0TWQ6_9SPHI|nr:ABC transporter permease [Mucilaginibacter sabulilitoris]WPU95560.1 ABC transporter permease [Mucilaginibacter sabulilitoris]
MKKEKGILIIFIILCVLVSVGNPNFLGATNLQNTARLIGIFGIFSIGSGIVIITRGIDLSVGSVFALVGVLLSMMLVKEKMPWPFALLIILALSIFIGWFQGSLIAKSKIQPFVVTLCGLLFYRGIARFISNDVTMGFGYGEQFTSLQYFATGNLLGIPLPFILLAVIGVISWLFLHRSVYGRYMFAIGRNEEAALYSGVNVTGVTILAYMISGLLAGIAGILLAFYTNAIAPSSHGNFYELYGIAAAVLGGCSLRGGEGSVIGVIIGAAMLQVIQNLVNLLGIPSSLNFAVMGFVILTGVFADKYLINRIKKPKSQLAVPDSTVYPTFESKKA